MVIQLPEQVQRLREGSPALLQPSRGELQLHLHEQGEGLAPPVAGLVERLPGGGQKLGRVRVVSSGDPFDGQQGTRVGGGVLVTEAVQVLQALLGGLGAERAGVDDARTGTGHDRPGLHCLGTCLRGGAAGCRQAGSRCGRERAGCW